MQNISGFSPEVTRDTLRTHVLCAVYFINDKLSELTKKSTKKETFAYISQVLG